MFPDRDELLSRILRAAEGYEFSSFVLAFERTRRVRASTEGREHGHLKTELGTALLDRWADRRVDFHAPDMRFEVALDGTVRAAPEPLFVAARYRKHSRSIPASRWIHHRCGGRGCEVCGHTGNLCGPSVEEVVSGIVLELARGSTAQFHALGREDTDARMLGTGRPFVLEVATPRIRTIDLRSLGSEVPLRSGGTTEILSPAVVGRPAVREVKRAFAQKSYRAWLEISAELPPDVEALAAGLGGTTVEQLTPRRILTRKKRDKVRQKRVVESSWIGEVDGAPVWEVRAESGTYIKELVSGDGGRTSPSLSSVLGVSCRCVRLDVLAVHWAGSWEAGAYPG